MLDEYSIEQRATQIFDARTKEYFSEVLSCYAAGNYRSSVVMLWSVVVCEPSPSCQPPPPGGFFTPSWFSVAAGTAVAIHNPHPANLHEYWIRGRKRSRGKQRKERGERLKKCRNWRSRGCAAREAMARNSTNTGAPGKKSQPIRVGILVIGGGGGN